MIIDENCRQTSPATIIASQTSRVGHTLSNLSTADEIVRNFSAGTPHTSNIPSSIFLWFTYNNTILLNNTAK
jgi:hypothetical protein